MVSYGRLKSAVEDNPLAETLSVVLLESPPSSNMSPDGSPQQRWKLLNCTSVSGNGVKVPLPLNFTQDLWFGYPPQKRLLHRLPPLATCGVGIGIGRYQNVYIYDISGAKIARLPQDQAKSSAV